jgi:NADPH:quinone reductase-like Zn-dependent oxidoreductase
MISGRMLCFGNFDIVGVILADNDYPPAVINSFPLPVPVPRFSAPPALLGQQIQQRLLGLLDAGAIRPIVGRTGPFEQLPQALEDMGSRTTFGRVVVER